MKQMVIATKNKGKANEFKRIFSEYNIRIISLLDLPGKVPDVEETGETFKENATLKAEQICSYFNTPVLADDSGLVVDALDGRPGIYSARYAGVSKNDEANSNKVLQELEDLPSEKRTARFVCVLAIAIPNNQTFFQTGYCEGEISYKEAGTNGFGYDPIFIPKGYS